MPFSRDIELFHLRFYKIERSSIFPIFIYTSKKLYHFLALCQSLSFFDQVLKLKVKELVL